MKTIKRIITTIIFLCAIIFFVLCLYKEEIPLYVTPYGDCFHFYSCITMDDCRENKDYARYNSIEDIPSAYHSCSLCHSRKKYKLQFSINKGVDILLAIFDSDKRFINSLVGTFVSENYYENSTDDFYVFECIQSDNEIRSYLIYHYAGEPYSDQEILYDDYGNIVSGIVKDGTITYSTMNQGGQLDKITIKKINENDIVLSTDIFPGIKLHRYKEKEN